MADSDLMFKGAIELAAMVRSGELSARELVALSLERIEALDPALNAFVQVDAERALASAEEIAPGDQRPFAGVPIAVKNNRPVRGMRLTYGCQLMAHHVSDYDHNVTRRLRDAGFVIVGTTTLPEYGILPTSEASLFGPTRNPWDLQRTPGGSSGGAAAAVAAGMVPVAHGNDGGGSIRIPAACCGLFGLKPQRDRVSRVPHDRDGAHWVVFGALTRSVRDGGIMLDVLSDDRHGFTEAARTRPAPLRIAVARGFPAGTRGRLSDDVARALDETAVLLRSLGHTVVERELDTRARDVPVILGIMFRLIHDLVGGVERPRRLERRSRAFARPGALVSDPMRARLLVAESEMVRHITALFDQHDAVLTPVMSRAAEPAGVMEGRGAIATYLWETAWVPFAILWNITGQPAASVPAGRTREGLPLGVQLIGRPHDERTILSVAAQLEAERGWTDERPPVS